jgi:hypothetical protein
MGKGAAISEQSAGENISHFGAIRVRFTGLGQLRLAVYSLDDIRSKTLYPFTMHSEMRTIPLRLVNFVEQRASFELKTTAYGEEFRINRIVVFMKEIYTSHPFVV